jgi:hypothetical protein
MVGSHHVFWERLTLFSIAKNTLIFTLIVQRVFSFSATAFSFCFSPWFLFRPCFIFASRCILTSGPCWFSSKELFQKGSNCVGKEKKKLCQKWYKKGSLFRLWFRLLHVVLDVFLIVCLVVFAVAWLVSDDWDCLMSLWKNHALFLLFGSINLVFSLMLYLGWLGACSQHVSLIQSRHKPLWSFIFDFWCHFMLLLMMFCRYAWLWPLLLF